MPHLGECGDGPSPFPQGRCSLYRAWGWGQLSTSGQDPLQLDLPEPLQVYPHPPSSNEGQWSVPSESTGFRQQAATSTPACSLTAVSLPCLSYLAMDGANDSL